MKGDDKEPLLEKEKENSNLFVNNNKNDLNKGTDEMSSYQPKYYYSKKGCIENKIMKYLICCFYNNYDFTYQENNCYNELKNSLGCVYDEKNSLHENLLEQFYFKLKSIIKELESSPNYQESDKSNRSTSVTNTLETDKKYIDNLWKVIGFLLITLFYNLF